MIPKVSWPEGKDFAFTVFDDTDCATLDNVGGVYAFLADCGFRTTKSCWPVAGNPDVPGNRGQTCEDPEYRRWLLDLQSRGFEIGWHGSTWHGLPRPEVFAAMERFAEIFRHDPAVAANHGGGEAMYWEKYRLTGGRALLYNLFTCLRNSTVPGGHLETNEHFWGDLCQEKIKYYRNFVFRNVNTLKACPFMPYHDPRKPYVNSWFASSDGSNVRNYNRCLAEKSQDRLEEEGGACIMYVHFAYGFGRPAELDPTFKRLMTRLSKKNGWFVPVGTLLDHLQQVNGLHEITDAQRRRLERKWLLQKLLVGTN